MYFYYVYIIKCFDNSYYTGITNNTEKRFEEHQMGYTKDSYTYKRRPLIMEFYQEFNDVLQAIYFEKKIKGWTRAKKQALINGNYDKLNCTSTALSVTSQ
ncbi:GIY-YIG nuclease family protein [Hwangdonia lutea]|uniref:GIY-YIG nuclease family protein n=1 Tax=Hwangdonia lutea TaxID=3075823 RepID=A0AA97EJ86_9FLAO|nr:GIY-YIG nuclease family protein [Hwangdonia sp. SCSIO 19198]WOD42066.1 GIY-YIG nuclease family protein [Hwangdonia sp. SCSIO 19198]